MRLREILRRKGSKVVTIGPEQSVADAIRKLNEHGIGALLVTGAEQAPIGIITERDILRLCGGVPQGDAEAAAGALRRPIADVMTKELVIAVPDDSVDYAMGVMTKNRIRHLPVLEGERLAGIVSIGDLVKNLRHEAVYENRMLRDYIQGTVAR